MKTMRYSNENVAHEMRTPLSSIVILINLLLVLGFTPKPQNPMVQKVRREKFLTRIIKSVYRVLSQADRGQQ